MEEVRYMISEAAKQVDVEAHVLRYWQKELDLPISRNEMEQRYYKNADIEFFKKVKQLKEQGFQLKAIKMLMPNLESQEMLNSETVLLQNDGQKENVVQMLNEENKSTKEDGTSLITPEESHEISHTQGTKMENFVTVMNQIIMSALKDNNAVLSDEVSINVSENVIKEMSYLMRLKEEKEEERYKKFDATLRDYQKGKLFAAAALEGKSRKRSKFFKKNRVSI